MNDFDYEERYGEKVMTDYEERINQEKINEKERVENLEKCIEIIKDLLETNPKTLEEYQELVSEIEYEVKCLD